ncbi:hypothetical protein [Mucilaginibacter sp.]|uniref:hypothetical protein n=1 Tax=Mucilaginibacter sp. TaxID=1882438 RepID=UPI0025DFB559|nr:hypothetical protein [Mucilaginibacter sp.]
MEFSEKDKITRTSSYKWPLATMAIAMVVYLLNFNYFAAWWIVLICVNLCASLLYIKVLFKSIVFWVTHAKTCRRPYFPLGINVATSLLICILPSSNFSKHYHGYTIDLSEYQKGCNCRLYLETYMVFGGGAWGGDEDSRYLKDSVSFRKYLGTFDEEEGMIITRCNGDKITVEQLERTELPAPADTSRSKISGDTVGHIIKGFKIKARAIYSLRRLKTDLEFE